MNLKENTPSERLLNGLIKENPTFVLMLGMCPTLAVTTSAVNGMGMGLTTMVVLALSNMLISLLRGIIPDKVRIPAFIVVIATFVTVVELLLKAYLPFLYDALGLYIPLIVVNCIILGRAEAYASKFKVVLSIFDGIGMGLGFTVALTVIGAIREVLGAGELFGNQVMPAGYVPNSIFVLAPGAFLVLACLTAIQNRVKRLGEKKGKDMSKIQSGCNADCMNCGDTGCSRRVFGEAEDTLEIIEITDDYEELRIEETLVGDKRSVDDKRPDAEKAAEGVWTADENQPTEEVRTAGENQPAMEAVSFDKIPSRENTDSFNRKVEWKNPKVVVEKKEDTTIIGAVEGPTSVFLATKLNPEKKAETDAKVYNEIGAEIKTKVNPKADTETKTDTKAKASSKLKADAKAKTLTKVKPNSKLDPKSKPKTGAKVKSDIEPENNHEKEERYDD